MDGRGIMEWLAKHGSMLSDLVQDHSMTFKNSICRWQGIRDSLLAEGSMIDVLRS